MLISPFYGHLRRQYSRDMLYEVPIIAELKIKIPDYYQCSLRLSMNMPRAAAELFDAFLSRRDMP